MAGRACIVFRALYNRGLPIGGSGGRTGSTGGRAPQVRSSRRERSVGGDAAGDRITRGTSCAMWCRLVYILGIIFTIFLVFVLAPGLAWSGRMFHVPWPSKAFSQASSRPSHLSPAQDNKSFNLARLNHPSLPLHAAQSPNTPLCLSCVCLCK
jgi:hypothetical protein